MNRPNGLLLTAWIMVVLEVAGWIQQYWPHPVHLHTFSIAALLVVRLISFVCIFYYAQGQNWARIFVLIASVLAILSLLVLRHEAAPGQVLIATRALLGVFFLYWLNTRSVRAYFTQHASSAAGF